MRTCRKSSMFLVHIACVKTVSEPPRLGLMEICLSEKQTPQVIVFSRKRLEKVELLERACVRPRQVRYQAALRPDCIALSILNYFREPHHDQLATAA